MAGTTLGELQELGAWKSETMVKRYAHFAPEQLRRAAETDLLRFGLQIRNRPRKKTPQPIICPERTHVCW